MTIPVVLLLCLFVGIVVGITSNKLSLAELLICGTFGLLLGGTPVGRKMNAAILHAGRAVTELLAGLLS